MNDFQIIEKEKIDSLHFPLEDVLQEKQDIAKRLSDLEKVTILGNGDHIKVELFFEDATTKYRVDTTVWGVTDARVILKQGIVLPINRIYKIVY